MSSLDKLPTEAALAQHKPAPRTKEAKMLELTQQDCPHDYVGPEGFCQKCGHVGWREERGA